MNRPEIKIHLLDDRYDTYLKLLYACGSVENVSLRVFSPKTLSSCGYIDPCCYNAIVVNTAMPGIDGSNALYRIVSEGNIPNLKLFLLKSEPFANCNDLCGVVVDGEFVEPTSYRSIISRIVQLCYDTPFVVGMNQVYCSYLERKAGRLLCSVGISPNLKGYKYLRYAIVYQSLLPHASMKNVIYPKMETKFSTSSQNIERAMRYAIETAWCYGDIFAQHKLFGNTVDRSKGKPVVTEFISTLGENLRLSQYEPNECYE